MSEGKKNDDGKVRMSLVPAKLVNDVTVYASNNSEYKYHIDKEYVWLLNNLDNKDLAVESLLKISSKCIKSIYKTSNTIEFDIIYDLAELYEYGADMHFKDSWKSVEPERWVDALGRHILEVLKDPDSIDDESGMHHARHVIWNCVTLIWCYNTVI